MPGQMYENDISGFGPSWGTSGFYTRPAKRFPPTREQSGVSTRWFSVNVFRLSGQFNRDWRERENAYAVT